MTAINDRADGALRFIHPAAAALAATLRAEAAVSPSARRPYSCHRLRARGRRDPPVPALRAAPAPRPAPGPLRPAPLLAVGARPRAVPPREAVGDPPGALHSLRGGGGFSSARLLPAPPHGPAFPACRPPAHHAPLSRPRRAAPPGRPPPPSPRGQRAGRFAFGFGSAVFLFAGCGFSRAFPAGCCFFRLFLSYFAVRSFKTPRLFSVRLLLFTRYSPGALRAQPAPGQGYTARSSTAPAAAGAPTPPAAAASLGYPWPCGRTPGSRGRAPAGQP